MWKRIRNETIEQYQGLTMTTKILTFRVPLPTYSALCASAAELGIPISNHIRRLIEQEHQADQVTQLRLELLNRLDHMTLTSPLLPQQSTEINEILLLSRATASHLNPQLVAQVRAKLAAPQQGVSA
jgi:hypothetical protein